MKSTCSSASSLFGYNQLVIRRRLVAALMVAALLGVANTADASLCDANCALARGRSHDQHLHHSQSSPLTSAQHHHHGGVTSAARYSGSLLSFRSPQCRVYSQLQALASAFKFSLTQRVLSTEMVVPDGNSFSSSGPLRQDPFFPNRLHSPPGNAQPSTVVPLRI